jgi:uncharacterized protein (TIGR00304 family)
MRLRQLGSAAALFAGVALIVLSVIDGGASVSLLVIIPIISGSSLVFLLGVVLLIAGFFSLPFALAVVDDDAAPTLPASTTPTSGTSGDVGGVVLIGPVPIVFGSWKGVSPRIRWALVLVGAVLLTFALVAFVLFVR